MADRTDIEWADASNNPIRARDRETGKIGWHCEHATPGCEHCYAEDINKRLGTRLAFTPSNLDKVEIFLDEKTLVKPVAWKKPRAIFWGSMTDPFARFGKPEWLDRILAVCALTPQHEHLFLTKRGSGLYTYLRDLPARPYTFPGFAGTAAAGLFPTRIKEAIDAIGIHYPDADTALALNCRAAWPLPNVVFGMSVEDQRRADERQALLFLVAELGWRTFVSYEPALGPVNWRGWEFLSGLISGGESGRHDRVHHPDWHRAARDFCAAHGIAYFFKQWGDWAPAPPVDEGGFLRPRTFAEAEEWAAGRPFEHHSDGTTMVRIGKANAGRELDGRTHSAMPKGVTR